jgi:hypothetical protein
LTVLTWSSQTSGTRGQGAERPGFSASPNPVKGPRRRPGLGFRGVPHKCAKPRHLRGGSVSPISCVGL